MSVMDERAALCPGMERFIREAAYAGMDGAEPIEARRGAYVSFCRRFRRPYPEGLTVEDAILPAGSGEAPARIYRPASLKAGRLAPCILYMHGGGWVLGSIDTHDCITAELAEGASAIVVSVDYLLAPEHPFPAAFNQCRAALRTLAEQAGAFGIDARRIAVAGDSAGANLAAALALASRDEGGPSLAAQALIYPVLGTGMDLPSYRRNATAPMLRTDEMADYWSHYLKDKPPAGNPYAEPLLAADLSGLPPSLIWTAGHDPVRDDGAVYARRLQEAGALTVYRCAPDLPHGYLRARGISASAAAEFEALCQALRNFLQQA